MSLTQMIVKRIMNTHGNTKCQKRNIIKESFDFEMSEIKKRQKVLARTQVNESYREAGYKAENITALIVQNQIANLARVS